MGEPTRRLPVVYNLLKNRDAAVRSRAAEQLRQIVQLSSGDMNPSQFSDLFAGVQTHLTLMIQGRVKDERLGAITAIDRLIDVSFNEASDTQTVRFANSLRNVFQVNLDVCDEEVLRLAARTLGHLARAGGAATSLTADFVDFEVTRALEWLREDVGRSAAPRRHAAVLILRELADNAPTLFYQKALMADAPGAPSRGSLAARRGSSAPQAEARFFPAIGAALHDAKASVREDAAAALSACLALVAQRKSKQDWFVQIYEFAQLGFKQNKEATVHGSLIIVSELLDHTTSCDQFMRRGSGSFTALCRTVLAYKDHREKLVRRTVVGLVPKLARFERETFVAEVLPGGLKHLLKVMKGNANERGAAFMAIGKLAQAVGPAIAPQLDAIVAQIEGASFVYRYFYANLAHSLTRSP
jgi:FKBP12-rapamycin complex-associated protein